MAVAVILCLSMMADEAVVVVVEVVVVEPLLVVVWPLLEESLWLVDIGAHLGVPQPFSGDTGDHLGGSEAFSGERGDHLFSGDMGVSLLSGYTDMGDHFFSGDTGNSLFSGDTGDHFRGAVSFSGDHLGATELFSGDTEDHPGVTGLFTGETGLHVGATEDFFSGDTGACLGVTGVFVVDTGAHWGGIMASSVETGPASVVVTGSSVLTLKPFTSLPGVTELYKFLITESKEVLRHSWSSTHAPPISLLGLAGYQAVLLSIRTGMAVTPLW
ncbi:hypothetical protein E2C01_040998 [Portunus trituberculatus]|uniref:Uncharacterized protein n=1 Tax=Portunus trituberculatus TaxID=210409 RepID=A0A5B7FPH5_PORTR|nr:hypothetical protein [Portunus trituberculatus]